MGVGVAYGFGHCKATDLTVSGGALGRAIAGPTKAVCCSKFIVTLSVLLDLSGLHPL